MITTLPVPQPAPEYRSTSPVMTFEQQVKLAEAFAKSGLFGVKTPDQALSLMALCEAEGLHPAAAVRDYHIVQGRPAMKAEAMLARFLKAGGAVEWHERTDQAADATFTHPSGGKVRVNWTMLMAKTAGLVGRDSWKNYPRSMLHARCVSEGVRAVCPQSTGHQYTPEEVIDFQGDIINGATGEVISERAEEQAKRDAQRDKYVSLFQDALDMDAEDEVIARVVFGIHQEANQDQDLYRSLWSRISSKDRTEIKKYIELAKTQDATNSEEL